ncbi:MAG: cold shock domain-containing protein [Planctomycetes bacterium]|nr:cold shock domain-containing protein [Planctomycetota bacterium]
MQEGQSVEFELGDGPNGPRAENIRVVCHLKKYK